jgi:thioredoxin-related protein
MKLFAAIHTFLLVFSFSQVQWLNNYDKAIEQSKEEKKPILLVFSGSDWCKPCIRLEQKVFQAEEFKQYATDKLVLLRADFPRKRKNKLPKSQKKHNEILAEKYNKKGEFPLVLLINSDGKILKRIETIDNTPNALIKQLKE